MLLFFIRRAALAVLMLVLPIAIAAQAPGRADLQVSGDRLNAHLEALGKIGATPEGGTHRVAYSEADREGREYAMTLMRAAKLEVSVDADPGDAERRERPAAHAAGARRAVAPGLVLVRKSETRRD
jgi:hypothetical protein